MNRKIIVGMLIILSLTLLIMMAGLLVIIKEETLNEEQMAKLTDYSDHKKTLEEIFIENDIEVISKDDYIIRLFFPVDLYNEDKTDNKEFFYNLIEDIKVFYDKKSFVLYDMDKNIEINVKYSTSKKEHEIIINDIENYFDNVDGKLYAEVDKCKIKKSSDIPTNNDILYKLITNNTYIKSIEKKLENPEELENGYTSYNNGAIKIRKSLINTVRHIIFTPEYDGAINRNIDMNTSLNKILEKYPQNAFGSIDEGYLGYISDFYYFFYKDEISIYSYSYSENKQFELLLDRYLETRNLDEFISNIKTNYKVYDYLEYNPEIQKAHILFPNRGIEINIEENDPKGIVLYSNYYLSDKTKKYIREGLITLNSYEDLLNKVEIERRK